MHDFILIFKIWKYLRRQRNGEDLKRNAVNLVKNKI